MWGVCVCVCDMCMSGVCMSVIFIIGELGPGMSEGPTSGLRPPPFPKLQTWGDGLCSTTPAHLPQEGNLSQGVL